MTEGNFGATKRGQGAPADVALERPAKALLVMIGLGGLLCDGAAQHPDHGRTVRHVTALCGDDQLPADDGGRCGRSLRVVRTAQFKQMRGDKLPWVAIIYPSVIPICCLAGIPISIWAGRMAERARAPTSGHECAAIDGSCLRNNKGYLNRQV